MNRDVAACEPDINGMKTDAARMAGGLPLPAPPDLALRWARTPLGKRPRRA